MGKPVAVPIPLIQSQLFISALLLNFPNNLAGGTHVKAESLTQKAEGFTPFLSAHLSNFHFPI
jgi:hypothetical protein